jgi:hypothetical protein
MPTLAQFVFEQEAQAVHKALSQAGLKPLLKSLSLPHPHWIIHLPEEQFSQAQTVLQQVIAQMAKQLPSNYHLHQYSDEELYELIERPEQYSLVDHHLAIQILEQRGKFLSPDALDSYLQQRRWKKIGQQYGPWALLLLAILGLIWLFTRLF